MKITKKLLKKMVMEEINNIGEVAVPERTGRQGAPTTGGPQSAAAAMKEIAGLVKSTAGQSQPGQALDIIKGIVAGWESALSDGHQPGRHWEG